MKHHLYFKIVMIALITTMVACNKELNVSAYSFEVTRVNSNGTPASDFKVGDTIGFSFKGNPDIITFYSGQIGKRYEYRQRTEAAGKALVQFNTVMSGSTLPNTLSLLISDDFKGIVSRTSWEIVTRDTIATSKNIAAATWTNITDRAAFSTGANSTAVSSGNIDLSDFAQKNKLVYIAFKYNAPAGVIQPKWVITNFITKNVLADSTEYTIANFNGPAAAFSNYGSTSYSPGWITSFDPDVNLNPNVAWLYNAVAGSNNPQRLEITGAKTAGAATVAEAWAIIGPVNLKKVTPDAGIGIKTIVNRLPVYFIPKSDNYTKAGTYNATFVASSDTKDQSTPTLKQLNINILP